MTQRKPDDRPSAVEAQEMWQAIRRRIWFIQRLRRLHATKETGVQSFFLNIRAFFQLGSALSRRWLPIQASRNHA